MRRLLAPALLALVTAGPAMALSCMPWDVASTYTRAAEAEEAYIVVHGTLTFRESKLPKVDWDRQQDTPPDTFIPARLKGKALTKSGFTFGFDRPVTLNAQCFGPWCAGAKSGIPYLAFVEKTDTGYVFALDPCGGMGVANPTPEMLDQVQRCYRGGACTPQYR